MEAVLQEKIDPKFQKLPLYDPTNPSRKYTEKEEKHLREILTYEFMNREEPGMMLKFTYGGSKNKHTFTFFHGGRYKVPRFIARHLESKASPIWGWMPDGSGRMQKTLKGSNPRFQMREVYE